MTLVFPRRSRGRQTAEAEARYQEELAGFCEAILQINSTLDFKVSARGWGYIFENCQAITKDQLDACEKLVNDCRKSGDLPLDICAVDKSREFENVEEIDDKSPEEMAQDAIDYLAVAHLGYRPISLWDNQKYYVQIVVEKIDLKSFFSPVCAGVQAPDRQWQRMGRSRHARRHDAPVRDREAGGKECVLLACYDHDPAGLNISGFLRSNMADMSKAIGGWSPENVIIERFGLNLDFIEANNLTWIDNLITSSGEDLANPNHHDHNKDYVQTYIKQFGDRKVEANALVVAPEAGRALCREAILKYVDLEAIEEYRAELEERREEVREALKRLLGGRILGE